MSELNKYDEYELIREGEEANKRWKSLKDNPYGDNNIKANLWACGWRRQRQLEYDRLEIRKEATAQAVLKAPL